MRPLFESHFYDYVSEVSLSAKTQRRIFRESKFLIFAFISKRKILLFNLKKFKINIIQVIIILPKKEVFGHALHSGERKSLSFDIGFGMAKGSKLAKTRGRRCFKISYNFSQKLNATQKRYWEGWWAWRSDSFWDAESWSNYRTSLFFIQSEFRQI